MVFQQKNQKEKQKQTAYKKVRNRNIIIKLKPVKLRVNIYVFNSGKRKIAV